MRPSSFLHLPRRVHGALAAAAQRCLLTASVLLSGLVAQAAVAASGMNIGPVDVPVTVRHVPLVVPVTLHLDVVPAGNALSVAATATGSLAGVQADATEIARALLTRAQACTHAGITPVVDRIDEAHLSGSGDEAVLAVSGHAIALACTKIFGQMAKTDVAASNVSIILPLRLEVGPDNSIGLVLAGEPHVTLGDPRVSTLVGSFSGDVDKLVRSALDHALDTSKARLAIPALAGMDTTIESASFVSQGRQLSVAIAAKAHMTGAGLTQLLALSVEKSRKQ